MKFRRSLLFVPGSNAAMVTSCAIFKPDCIMFDLEDAVSQKEKDSARFLVFHTLAQPFFKDIELIVRVNPLNSAFGLKDLEFIVRAGVDVIRLPKTESAEDIEEMEYHVEKIEQQSGRAIGSTKLLAAIESATGIVNINEIAKSSERLIGIALGAEDYVRNIRTERSPGGIELLHARCSILQAARANNIMAFDTVYTDVNNEEGFIQEASLIKQLGFDGKSLINPRQIEIIHHLYAPSQEEYEYALQVVKAARLAEEKGHGVASLKGKMIDSPVIERAKLVLEKVKLSGVREIF